MRKCLRAVKVENDKEATMLAKLGNKIEAACSVAGEAMDVHNRVYKLDKVNKAIKGFSKHIPGPARVFRKEWASHSQ